MWYGRDSVLHSPSVWRIRRGCYGPGGLEVFRRIGEGMTTRQIADSLGITIHTVNTHREAIVAKIGAVGADLVRTATLTNQTHAVNCGMPTERCSPGSMGSDSYL